MQTQGATPDALDAEATGASTDPDVDKLTESLDALKMTQVGYLLSDNPIPMASSSKLPTYLPAQDCHPIPDNIKKLLMEPAQTEREEQYKQALLEMVQHNAHLQGQISGLQAVLLL